MNILDIYTFCPVEPYMYTEADVLFIGFKAESCYD